MYSTHYFFQILMKLEFSRQIFGKKAQISNFIKIRPLEPLCSTLVGGRADVRADGHDEASSCFFAILRNRPKISAGHITNNTNTF